VKRPPWAYYDHQPEGDAAGNGAPPGPEVVDGNLTLVYALLAGQPVWFRGEPYVIPPVPFREGVKLDALRKAWDAAVEAGDTGTVLRLYEAGTRLLKRLVRPVHPFRRLLWRVSKNPFRDVSNGEFNDLLGFCLICRMKSTIRGSSPSAAPASARSLTEQTPWRSSPTPSRAG
jgi:hypothetical protein